MTKGVICKVTDHILYRDARYYSAFPSITTLLDGSFLLLFRRAADPRWLLSSDFEHDPLQDFVSHVAPRSHLAQVCLDANLSQLGKVETIAPDADAAEQDPSLVTLHDGSLLLSSFGWYPLPTAFASRVLEHFNGVAYGEDQTTGCRYLSWGCFTRRSFDRGQTWSAHRYLPSVPGAIDMIPGKRGHHGGFVRGQMIEKDGELFLATYGLVPSIGKKSATFLYVSSDGGACWNYRATIAWDKQVDLLEPALSMLSNGQMIAFMRTSGLGGRLVTATSTDNGHTWHPWRAHDVMGCPFHPLALPDGRIFLSYGYRKQPYGVRARIFTQQDTIDSAQEVVLRDDGMNGDVGYPWGALLPNGRIVVVYYFSRQDSLRSIEASLVEI